MVKLITSKNKRAIRWSRRNQRRHDVVAVQMMGELEIKGIVFNVSGVPTFTEGEGDLGPECFEALTGGTRLGASCRLHLSDPTNQYVISVFETNLPNCAIIGARSQMPPNDVLEFIVEDNNRYTDGAPESWVEKLEVAEEHEKTWLKDPEFKKAGPCPTSGDFIYAELCWKFISKKFLGDYPNQDSWSHAKIVRNSLDLWQVWTTIEDRTELACDFLHAKLARDVFLPIRTMRSLNTVLTKEELRLARPADERACAFSAVLELAYPRRDDGRLVLVLILLD